MKETLDVWVIMPLRGPFFVVDNTFFDLHDDAARRWREGKYDLTGYAVRSATLTVETE